MKIKFLATGHSEPIPEEKLNYVGEWQSEEVYLRIIKDGTVDYKRQKGKGDVSIKGPIKKFVDDDFVVGESFITATFEISQPPQLIDGKWKMTVDGVQLIKTKE